jgi:sugar phosphate isomerase/epimerase
MILYTVGRNLSQFWNDAMQWVDLHTAESMVALGVIVLGGGYLSKWLLDRKSTRSEALRVMRESINVAAPEESSEMSFFVANRSQSDRAAPKPKERVIREKTREDISTMFNTLKSIPQDTKVELPPVEFVDPTVI